MDKQWFIMYCLWAKADIGLGVKKDSQFLFSPESESLEYTSLITYVFPSPSPV